MVFDPSFVKAWSIRHPDNGRTGFSDPDAQVGGMDGAMISATRYTYP